MRTIGAYKRSKEAVFCMAASATYIQHVIVQSESLEVFTLATIRGKTKGRLKPVIA